MERPTITTRQAVGGIFCTLLLFLAGNLLASLPFDLLFSVVSLPAGWLYAFCRYLGTLAVTWLLFRWYITRVRKERPADYGLDFSLRRWALPCGVLLPLAVAGVYLLLGETTLRQVPPGEAAGVVLSALAMAAASGITEEIAFRGCLMTLVRRRWGRRTAILLPSLLFAAMHIPGMRTVSPAGVLLLLGSGTLVGVMFSLAAELGGSIWNSALLHGLWNLVMVTGILRITTPSGAWGSPLISVLIPEGNLLLTGGDFGVEASLISCLGYGLVCAAILLLERRRS